MLHSYKFFINQLHFKPSLHKPKTASGSIVQSAKRTKIGKKNVHSCCIAVQDRQYLTVLYIEKLLYVQDWGHQYLAFYACLFNTGTI